jgi:hypothetical protein
VKKRQEGQNDKIVVIGILFIKSWTTTTSALSNACAEASVLEKRWQIQKSANKYYGHGDIYGHEE